MDRRRFLTTLLAGALAACAPDAGRAPRVGLALGGGGVRGVAHILAFEALDELGVRPHRIAGTSIGAIFGALYAAGHSGKAIRAMLDQLLIGEQDTWQDILFHKSPLRWLQFIDISLNGGGLLDSDDFVAYLVEQTGATRFEQLAIPLQVVATDLWTGKAVVFDSGELTPAIKASIAIPGILRPVPYRDGYLVDGGVVDPLPYDLLQTHCDLVVAIDVSGELPKPEDGVPSYPETLFHSFHHMQKQIIRRRLQEQPPDIYLAAQVHGVRALEFYKAAEVFEQAAPLKAQLQARLRPLLRRG